MMNLFQQHKRNFLIFAFAGLGTATIYFSLFFVCWNLLHMHHIPAVTVAFIGCVIFHFLMNRNVTFKAKGNLSHHLWKYLTVITLNYLITLVVVQFIVSLKFSPYLGLLIAVALTSSSGYILFNFWVFKTNALKDAS